jgi:hypothetical protein
MRLDTLPEDLAGLAIEPRRGHVFQSLESFDGPPKPALLEDYVRAELARTDSTPEHAAWIQRAAVRLHLVPI